MSKAQAEAAIAAKRLQLVQRKLDLGAAQGEVQPAGHGGFVLVLQRGRIYWHAATGAHEVHGNILLKYLAHGGPDFSSRSRRREFGFPTTDELGTADGIPCHGFEWGAIYAMPGTGGVFVNLDIFKATINQRDVTRGGELGLPVDDPVATGGEAVSFFERGCAVELRTVSAPILARVARAPRLGQPALIGTGTGAALPLRIACKVPRSVFAEVARLEGGDNARATARLASVWNQRLVLQPVAAGNGLPIVFAAPRLALTEDQAIRLPNGEPAIRPGSATITLDGRIDGAHAAMERTLYSISLTRRDGRRVDLFPHAVYAKSQWRDFGLVHATDIHVSERVEGFRRRLREAGEAAGVAALVNPNDSFRTFIRWANREHAAGRLDLVLATGDLVEYVFEAHHSRTGGGNFRFFEQLVRGQAASPDAEGERSEALRVPIFTSLGNHDYRVNPFQLFFDINVPVLSDPTIRQYGGYNLVEAEARALQGGRKPTVSSSAATAMVARVTRPNAYYKERINGDTSYEIRLGARHRILMLDTGPDRDIIGGIVDALEEFFGFSNADEKTFVRGTPNSRGIDLPPSRLERLLDQTDGLVIVGMHAPPFNPGGSEYPYYFRETVRPKLSEAKRTALVQSFISREARGRLTSVQLRKARPDWSRSASRHFKSGEVGDLLAFGIANEKPMDWLRAMAGVGRLRPVDLVLCGHVHEAVEFRLDRTTDGKLLYLTDFYTENPGAFHKTYDHMVVNTQVSGAVVPAVVGDPQGVHVVVGSDPDAKPIEGRGTDHRAPAPVSFRRINTPPYAEPLARASDKAGWWRRHRPLVIQSASLGPIDHTDRRAKENDFRVPPPRFQGVRSVAVVNDVITDIRLVTIDEQRRLIAQPQRRPASRVPAGGEAVVQAATPKVREQPAPVAGHGPQLRDQRRTSGAD